MQKIRILQITKFFYPHFGGGNIKCKKLEYCR